MHKPIFEKEDLNYSNLYFFISLMSRKYFKIALIFVVLYVSYFFLLKDTKYSASVSFYTNYNQDSGGLSVLLMQSFAEQGFNDLNFSIQNFLKSDNFYNKIIFKDYNTINGKKNLIEIWNLQGKAPLININQIPDLNAEDRKYLQAKNRLKESISFIEDKKTGLNTISVIITKYPDLAIQVIDNIYNAILFYASEVTYVKGEEKSLFIEKRLQEISSKLEKAENEMIDFLEKNKDINSPNLTIQRTRIQRDINVNNSVFLSLSNQLELARIEEKNNTSSVFVLDGPILADQKAGRGLFVNMLILFVGIIGLLSIRDIFINRKQLFIF